MCKREENIMDFAERLCHDMAERVGANYEVTIYETSKNNEVERVALLIRKRDAGAFEMYPTIYLEELFELYCAGTSYEKILEDVETANAGAQKKAGRNVSWVKDFSQVKDKICFKLINEKANCEILRVSPHRSFHDMAIVYYVFLDLTEDGVLTMPINNYFLDVWNQTESDLWELAYANTCQVNPVKFGSLKESLEELLGDFPSTHAEHSYVLGGRYGTFGTAHVLYPSELSKIAEKVGDDLYFMPTSIHEWFVVPVSEMESANEMSEMASEYFAMGLEEEEDLLSKNIYCYDRRKGFYMISK